MSTGEDGLGEPTLLKALLRTRHWQKHAIFTREWDKVAKKVDPRLVGSWPRHAQFYRWLRGDLRELPYPDACRVLESMFPQYNVRELFEPCPADVVTKLAVTPFRNTAQRVDHLDEVQILTLWPRMGTEVLEDLRTRVSNAHDEVSIFGITGSSYLRDDTLPLFEQKAREIPITLYVMDPNCESRRDRYRLEPAGTAMEDPARYKREILWPLFAASRRVSATTSTAGLRVLTYNFPCSFAIERVDRNCRVMPYGHGYRGGDGPVLIFGDNNPYWDYFTGQIQWLELLATTPQEPWISKGLVVRPLQESDLAL